MYKPFLLILAGMILLAPGWAKTSPLSFSNPGNRRLLKTEAGNYYYYRSLPEKSMTLNVSGIESIELRSFAIESLRKPKVHVVIDRKSTAYDLKPESRLNGFHLYEPVKISIPRNTESIEILCYERSIYFRPFYTVPPKPKTSKPARPANRVIRAHGGIMTMTHNGNSSEYYTFNPSQSFKFTLNNSRDGIVYVRARLLDRSLPEFDLYHNGELVETHEFSLKRTTQYKVVGIDHLSTGMKISLPKNGGSSEYELRAKSDHLFLAKPVLLKEE